MDLSEGFHINDHTQRRMARRKITADHIAQVLASYHTSYPAEPLAHRPYRCTVYVATVDRRELKVYVEQNTHPPLVRTVAEKDW